MSPQVQTLDASWTLRDAAHQLATHGIGCVVITESGRAAGIVTERDIVRIAAAEPVAWASMTVGSVMTRPLRTIPPDARIELAIAALAQHHIRRLVVVSPEHGLAGIITQTDLLRAAQRQLDDLASDLERLMGANEAELSTTDLVSLAVHDIKNSVGAIDVAREMLDESLDAAPSVLPLLGRATARIGNLACTLLDLNRLQHGVMPITVTDTSWQAVHKAAMDEVTLLAHAKKVALRATGASDTVLRCDRDLVERVLLNLLDNAINAAPDASTIDVHGERTDVGGFRIRVANRGPVIPAEALPRLFEPYRRGAVRGPRRGWGLGLTFCRLAVERHGGTIRAISPYVDGEGAALELDLPAEPTEASEP
jgi:signal transduction histidine kinase